MSDWLASYRLKPQEVLLGTVLDGREYENGTGWTGFGPAPVTTMLMLERDGRLVVFESGHAEPVSNGPVPTPALGQVGVEVEVAVCLQLLNQKNPTVYANRVLPGVPVWTVLAEPTGMILDPVW